MIKKCGYCGTVNIFNRTGYCKNCDRRLTQETKADNQKGRNLNPLLQVVDETVLETKVDFDTTVKCLMDQTGKCRENLADGTNIEFICQKDGDIWVRPIKDNYMGFVDGKVYTENGKTKVVIRSKKDRSSKGSRTITILLPYIILVALFIVLIIRKIYFTITMLDVLVAIFLLFSLLFSLTDSHKQSQNITSDLQIMKGEVIRRIRAIERWDD